WFGRHTCPTNAFFFLLRPWLLFLRPPLVGSGNRPVHRFLLAQCHPAASRGNSRSPAQIQSIWPTPTAAARTCWGPVAGPPGRRTVHGSPACHIRELSKSWPAAAVLSYP